MLMNKLLLPIDPADWNSQFPVPESSAKQVRTILKLSKNINNFDKKKMKYTFNNYLLFTLTGAIPNAKYKINKIDQLL